MSHRMNILNCLFAKRMYICVYSVHTAHRPCVAMKKLEFLHIHVRMNRLQWGFGAFFFLFLSPHPSFAHKKRYQGTG